ncbi:hypothetical protein LC55x_0021 [Lysobacter capsici]|nr:hypothetical protein LC55x_0021 [Lysobacter capsici]
MRSPACSLCDGSIDPGRIERDRIDHRRIFDSSVEVTALGGLHDPCAQRAR